MSGVDVNIELQEMLSDLECLVNCESKTGDLTALEQCADELIRLGDRLLAPHAKAERVTTVEGSVVMWRFGATPRLALVGHYDTVHPAGTLDDFPFSVAGDTIRGPGTYDMKAGLLVALYGCARALERDPHALDGVVIFCNPDEEDGSKASIDVLRCLVEAGLGMALVFEGGGDNGEVRTTRKGGMWLNITFHGKDAHGSRPEEGVNALEGVGDYLHALPMLASPFEGTTVVPTMAGAGTAINTAPGEAHLVVDVRTASDQEQQRVLDAITTVKVNHDELRVEHEILHRFPAMPSSVSAPVLQQILVSCAAHGLAPVVGSPGMGATDANHLARLGVAVIDGLGPAGGNDHSPDEWASLSSMIERVELISRIVPDLAHQSREIPNREAVS